MSKQNRLQGEVLQSQKNVLRFIGLDVSLAGTGVVVIDGNRNLHTAYNVGYSLTKTSSEDEKMERMIYITKKIMVTINKYVKSGIPPYILLERPAYSQVGKQNDLSELQGIIKSNIYLKYGYCPTLIVATSARKTVFGKGKLAKGRIANKKAIMKALIKSPFSFDCGGDDNIADAYVIAESYRIKLIDNIDIGQLFKLEKKDLK